jgi:mannose-1-phosphate guanylyltransferase
MTKAVVLCAGMGTRLGHLTQSTPKPLLPIGDEPLLGHTLRWLASYGYRDVAVNLHFMPELITRAIGDGARWGAVVHYSHEERLLGTAGALRRLRAGLGDARDVLVVYGDLLIDQDLDALRADHARTNADATLLLHERPGSNSLVAMNEERRITGFVERPTEEERARHPYPWTNSGVAIVSTELVDLVPDGTVADLPRDVYAPRVHERRFFGHPLTGYRCAIDSPERYDAARAAFDAGRLRDRTS